MTIDTNILRKMWRFVETSNPYTIAKLSDEELVRNLIRQVESISPLAAEDLDILSRYITDRTPLIRDVAQSKLAIG
ncbi:MAG: hypothetical protein AAFQ80_18570 [Cyanobacteria bacterium J06621_8]